MGGVDEAGRGCIIGPLVVAGVSLDSSALPALAELGVRDSKQLSRRRREALYGEILRVCTTVVSLRIPPPEIDEYVRSGRRRRKLNYLEAIYMARVVDRLGAETAYVDAADTNTRLFSAEISENLSTRSTVVAEHSADRNYRVVSAASIVAKVERDEEAERLRKRHGDFGSGYPSDRKTMKFLAEWVRERDAPPQFSRRSWRSWDRILTRRLP